MMAAGVFTSREAPHALKWEMQLEPLQGPSRHPWRASGFKHWTGPGGHLTAVSLYKNLLYPFLLLPPHPLALEEVEHISPKPSRLMAARSHAMAGTGAQTQHQGMAAVWVME